MTELSENISESATLSDGQPDDNKPRRLESSFGLVSKLEGLSEPVLEDLGLDLVRILISGKERKTIQIMIDRLDETVVSVDNCADASHALSAIYDVEDVLGEDAYVLEVTSPGIDRPLTRQKDFSRFEGLQARLETISDYDGRRRFKGQLCGVEDNEILMECDGLTLGFPFEDINKAKLIFDEAMLKPKKP